jgi:hypothetical protein
MSRYVRRAETHGCAALCFALALGAGLTAHRAVAQQLPTASPEEVGMSSARLEGLDRGVQRWIDDGQIAGAVLLVARDGKVVHLSALGHRYREASDGMEVDDIFYIQSMTKSIVTTALTIRSPGTCLGSPTRWWPRKRRGAWPSSRPRVQSRSGTCSRTPLVSIRTGTC